MAAAEEDAASGSSSTNIFLQIVENPDGTIHRPEIPASPPSGEGPVISKDVVLKAAKSTSLRLYLPNYSNNQPPHAKLPVVLYIHGGGFVLFRASSAVYHHSCEQMAASLPALVISLDYRLSPEHRLPAAYHDAADAIAWIGRDSPDPWLADHGDLGRFFVVGSSSGANIAYQTAVIRSAEIEISGVVLNQIYAGGLERTASEAASEGDPMVPLRANDLLWRLALPEGAARDHEFCDLAAALRRRRCVPMPMEGGAPMVLMVGNSGDPLIDRQKELAGELEGAWCGRVVSRFGGEGFHAVELVVPAAAEEFFNCIREFMSVS